MILCESVYSHLEKMPKFDSNLDDVLRLLRVRLSASDEVLRELVMEAHRVSLGRRYSSHFSKECVMSVIRRNIRRIRENLGKVPVPELFSEDIVVEPKYPIRMVDPLCVLLPNECWAGKGSGGKTNFSLE
jgi:hypothetical protein